MNSYAMSLRDGKNIAFEDFGNTRIPLPPLDEQRKIVNQTEEEIAIVEQNKRLIEIFEKKISDKISEVWGE